MGKKLNAGYGCIFGTYWMIYAVVSSFASVFLLAKGYTNSQIGITLALANVLAVIMQPIVADFADRSKKLGVIGVTEIMTAMMMVFTLGLYIFKSGGAGICVAFVLLIGWHTVLQPLFNGLTFRLEETGHAINFGIARAVGSLAYSLLVAVLGTLTTKFGIWILPLTSEITCLLLMASLIFVGINYSRAKGISETEERMRQPANCEGATEEVEEITLLQFVRRNKLFLVVNIGVIGLFFSNAILNNYMAQIVEGVGGTTEDMGRILSVMAALEIPTMVMFDRIKKHFSCQLLLKIAAMGFAIKIAICWLANSVVMLYVGQIFQLVSFALWLPSIVYFTDEIMSRGEAIKGQALFTTMVTATTIASSLLGGWILDGLGPKMLTFIATIVTAAGAVLIIAVVDKVKREREV